MRARKCALLPSLLLLITSITACSARQTLPYPNGLPTDQLTPSLRLLPPTLALTSVPNRMPTPSLVPVPSPVEGSTVEPSPAEAVPSTAPPAEATSIPPPSLSIEVVSPNGGEEWLEGSTRRIVWTSSGVQEVEVAVASAGKPLGHVALGVGATSGQLLWDIPVGLISNFGVAESDAMRVRVSSRDDPSLYDENDAAFTVRCPRIRFEPGATSASVSGTLAAGGDRFRYVLSASAGQTMEIEISPAQIKVVVWGAQDASMWDIPSGQSSLTIPSLPASQDYFVTLTSASEAEAVAYKLYVFIR